jgi:hypothetical protein
MVLLSVFLYFSFPFCYRVHFSLGLFHTCRSHSSSHSLWLCTTGQQSQLSRRCRYMSIILTNHALLRQCCALLESEELPETQRKQRHACLNLKAHLIPDKSH